MEFKCILFVYFIPFVIQETINQESKLIVERRCGVNHHLNFMIHVCHHMLESGVDVKTV